VTQVKICCIQSPAEAALAVAAGAQAVGLVSRMPSGPGVIDDARIAEIARTVPPSVATVLLTSRRGAAELVAHARALGTSAVQIVDTPEPGARAALRAALAGVTVMQVVHVTGPASVDEAAAFAAAGAADAADTLLLDSGNPSLAVKELGGTGRTHDWTLSRRIRDAVRVPVWLAGGLHAGNVAEAITVVRPHGVDVCSGVRLDGRLDAARLAAFLLAVREASAG
jgi:phosphoribosylanthranilate isomerase